MRFTITTSTLPLLAGIAAVAAHDAGFVKRYASRNGGFAIEKRAAKTWSTIVAFGASYTDNGHPRNASLQGTFDKSPSVGGRHCDGKVTIEWLADSYGANLTDNAYAGAHVYNNDTNRVESGGDCTSPTSCKSGTPPDTYSQTNTFLAALRSGSVSYAPGRVLYHWWAGINSVEAIWTAAIDGDYTPTLPAAQLIAQRIYEQVTALENQLKQLSKYANVAHDYLILPIPPLELLPWAGYNTKTTDAAVKQQRLQLLANITSTYNNALLSRVKAFNGTLISSGKDTRAYYYDIPSFWQKMHSDPASPPFYLDATKIKYPCLGAPPNRTVCDNKLKRIYWDHTHPMTHIDNLVADAIKQSLPAA